jgi:SAM-dependent methyltransferase
VVDPQLQRLLICPKCHGELEFRARWIHCHACQSGYPVEGQIPVMLTQVSNDGFGHDLYRAQLHGNFFEKVFHTNRIETLLQLIGNELALPPSTRTLDVGCNTGPMLIPLRERGYDIVGIDISPGDIQQAERYLCQYRLPHGCLSVADATCLPFRDGSFDLLLLVDILEHTDHPERIVSEARRLLAPGGWVIATVPWAYHPYVRYTWIRKAMSSRQTIDEHPDAPFKLHMLQDLFAVDPVPGEPTFQPVLFRLVFHWVCILGIYRLVHPVPAPGQVPADAMNSLGAPSILPRQEEPVSP